MSDYTDLEFSGNNTAQSFLVVISMIALVLSIILGICWKFVPDNAEKTKSIKIRNAFYGMLGVFFISLCLAYPHAIPELIVAFTR